MTIPKLEIQKNYLDHLQIKFPFKQQIINHPNSDEFLENIKNRYRNITHEDSFKYKRFQLI